MTAASDRESAVVALPGVMALMGLLLFVLRSHVAAFFSDDPAVIAVVTECMLVLAIFQVRSFVHSFIVRHRHSEGPEADDRRRQ